MRMVWSPGPQEPGNAASRQLRILEAVNLVRELETQTLCTFNYKINCFLKKPSFLKLAKLYIISVES